MLSILTFVIAREQNAKPWKVIAEHVAIAVVVIVIAHFVGGWIASTFC